MDDTELLKQLEIIKSILTEKGFFLSTAESITLGRIAANIGLIPGASHFFKGGIVAYAEEAKIRLLNIPSKLIETKGVVSPEVCRLMAENISSIFKTEIGLSTTGYAGPAVGDEPVGRVFIGLCISKKQTIVKEYRFSGTRLEIQKKTAKTAIKLLWEEVKKI